MFKKIAMGILALFMGMMIFVTVVAYARPSGSTRQDMATAHLLRLKAAEAKGMAETTGYERNTQDSMQRRKGTQRG